MCIFFVQAAVWPAAEQTQSNIQCFCEMDSVERLVRLVRLLPPHCVLQSFLQDASRELWCDLSQGVQRKPWHRTISRFTQKSIIYSFELDAILKPEAHLLIEGYEERYVQACHGSVCHHTCSPTLNLVSCFPIILRFLRLLRFSFSLLCALGLCFVSIMCVFKLVCFPLFLFSFSCISCVSFLMRLIISFYIKYIYLSYLYLNTVLLYECSH